MRSWQHVVAALRLLGCLNVEGSYAVIFGRRVGGRNKIQFVRKISPVPVHAEGWIVSKLGFTAGEYVAAVVVVLLESLLNL